MQKSKAAKQYLEESEEAEESGSEIDLNYDEHEDDVEDDEDDQEDIMEDDKEENSEDQQEVEEDEESEEIGANQESEEDEEDVSEEGKEDNENAAKNKGNLQEKIIEQEVPQLQALLKELEDTIESLNAKVQPILTKVEAKQVETKHGMTYLEMKYNLLLSYCSFLSFYVLLKLEGKPVKDHPVISRLLHIKTLLERLRPLDQKLQYQIDKMLRMAEVAGVQGESKVVDNLQYKPNIESMKNDNADDNDEEQDDDEEDSESEEDVRQKKVFKAAKLNPVRYEDKETKKQRRDEMIQRKKMSRSSYVNELRNEVYDMPEEIHLGGMASQKTKFTREMDQIESMEQEHFKRMNFTKKELKDFKRKAAEATNERLEQLDDLRGIEDIIGSGKKGGSKGGYKDQMNAEQDNEMFHQSLNKYLKSSNNNNSNDRSTNKRSKLNKSSKDDKKKFQTYKQSKFTENEGGIFGKKRDNNKRFNKGGNKGGQHSKFSKGNPNDRPRDKKFNSKQQSKGFKGKRQGGKF